MKPCSFGTVAKRFRFPLTSDVGNDHRSTIQTTPTATKNQCMWSSKPRGSPDGLLAKLSMGLLPKRENTSTLRKMSPMDGDNRVAGKAPQQSLPLNQSSEHFDL